MTKFWPTPRTSDVASGRLLDKDGNRTNAAGTMKYGANLADIVNHTPKKKTATPVQSTLFVEDTHASRSAMPGSEAAQKMTAISGRKCYDLLKLSGRAGCLPKMLLVTSQWASTMCYLTWKTRVTPGGRLLFQLAPSMPDTAEIGSGLWATPQNRDYFPAHSEEYVAKKKAEGHGMRNLNDEVRLWSTPNSRDWKGAPGQGCRERGGRQASLPADVKMWPTPATRDYKGANSTEHLAKERGHHDQLPNAVKMAGETKGSLNPAWVAWLMGFPLDWLDLDGYQNPELEGLTPEYRSESQN